MVLPPGKHNGKIDSIGGGLRCPSALLVKVCVLAFVIGNIFNKCYS